MITVKDVEHVAKLARLELTEDEKVLYTKQLGDVLKYVDQMNEVDTSDVKPMTQVIDFVNVIKKTTRTTDSIIRWGGDEFILVLEGVSLELIEVIASKLQHAISTIHIKGVIEDVTVSIGFTYFSESDSSYKDTLNRADESLYIIKQSGRNNWRLG